MRDDQIRDMNELMRILRMRAKEQVEFCRDLAVIADPARIYIDNYYKSLYLVPSLLEDSMLGLDGREKELEAALGIAHEVIKVLDGKLGDPSFWGVQALAKDPVWEQVRVLAAAYCRQMKLGTSGPKKRITDFEYGW